MSDGAAGARPAPGQLEAKREAVVACYRACIDALDQLDAMDHPQTSVDLFREALAEFEVAAMANGYRDGREVSALPGAAASGREDERAFIARWNEMMSTHAHLQLSDQPYVLDALREALSARSAPRPGGQAAGDDRFHCATCEDDGGPCSTCRPIASEPEIGPVRYRIAPTGENLWQVFRQEVNGTLCPVGGRTPLTAAQTLAAELNASWQAPWGVPAEPSFRAGAGASEPSDTLTTAVNEGIPVNAGAAPAELREADARDAETIFDIDRVLAMDGAEEGHYRGYFRKSALRRWRAMLTAERGAASGDTGASQPEGF